MLMILSPAKSLDYESPLPELPVTQPALLDQAEQLVKKARTLSRPKLKALMGISDKLIELNRQRFADWSRPFDADNARPAAYAFKGDVYLGLDAPSLPPACAPHMQRHLRILSGLYGVLRPLDLMQPYRLEMGLPFKIRRKQNLYQFWGQTIAEQLNEALPSEGAPVVNLASNEYWKAVDTKALQAPVVRCDFRERKDGKLRIVSFFAKRARGMMARYAIEHELTDVEQLKAFDVDGYAYDAEGSSDEVLLFVRDAR